MDKLILSESKHLDDDAYKWRKATPIAPGRHIFYCVRHIPRVCFSPRVTAIAVSRTTCPRTLHWYLHVCTERGVKRRPRYVGGWKVHGICGTQGIAGAVSTVLTKTFTASTILNV